MAVYMKEETIFFNVQEYPNVLWLNTLIHYLVICSDMNPIRAEYKEINTFKYFLIMSQGLNSL